MRLLTFLVFAAAMWAQDPGRRLFEAQCALCHGQNGGGGRGPTLLTPKLAKASTEAALLSVIENGIPPEMPGAWQLSANEKKQVAAYVTSLGKIPAEIVPGDADRGRDVYARNGCAGCHIIAGEGAGRGPELTGIGSRRNAAHLRQAIVEPAAALPEGFLMLEAVPVTGAPVTGVRLSEDPFTVQLQDASGRWHSFRKATLKDLRKLPQQSPMPAFRQLVERDLDDLVAYLASRKGKP